MDEEFCALVEREKNSVYRLAYSYCREEADDIFQEVFLRYLKARPAFPDEDRERAWFLKVTANLCKSHLRSPWNRCMAALEADMPAPEREESGMVELVDRLPPKYRAVIHLYYYEGYSAKECAALLGLTETAVQTRLQRGREKLRQMLEKEERNGLDRL